MTQKKGPFCIFT